MKISHAVVFCLLAGLSSLFSGCSAVNSLSGTISGAGIDNSPPPTKLMTFHAEKRFFPVWMKSVGSNIREDCLKLGPIIVDGVIFTGDARGGSVTATELQKGRQIWWAKVGTPISSGPAVGEGLVVVATNSGKIIALSQAKGKLLWKANVPNAVFASPAVGQGRIIVKTIDGKVVALSTTGQILWTYDNGAPLLVMRSASAPQIVNDRVLVGFADGKLMALALNDGRVLWENIAASPTGASEVEQMVDVAADPVIYGKILYVTTYQGRLTAINIVTGQTIWQQEISSYAGLALNNRMIFVTDAQDHLFAFDRMNGRLIWQQNQLVYRCITAPVLIDNMLVIGDKEGDLHGVSLSDGRIIARHMIENGVKIVAPPAVLGNTLFVAGANGDLSAWRVG